jgi:hypothetical protein
VIAMRHVKSRPTSLGRQQLEIEVARLRGLDTVALRACWRTVFRRRAPPRLPRHLLFRVLAYQLQADRLGDLDDSIARLLDRSASPAAAAKRAAQFGRDRNHLRPGTLLVREWKGEPKRVMVVTEGFAWQDKVYPSLSKVAFAITGSRWNGPRFFGLRDPPSSQAGAKQP